MASSILVVVTGSVADSRFAVTNFSDPSAPTTVFVTPPFPGGGCLADCSNNIGNQGVGTANNANSALAAVGNYQGSMVSIYDLTNTAAPVLLNTFDTGLGSRGLTGIGALSLDQTNLIVGEANGPNIVLMDISQSPTSAVVNTYSAGDFADGGVYSITLVGMAAVVSGQFTFDVLIYGTPGANPAVITYTPAASNGNINFQGPVASDFDGSTVLLGDGSANVFSFTLNYGEQILYYNGTYGTGLDGGVTSVAVETGNAAQIAAGSISSGTIVLVTPPAPPNPPVANQLVQIFTGPGPNPGGALQFFGLPNLIASSVTGSTVTWLNTLGWPTAPTLVVAPAAGM